MRPAGRIIAIAKRVVRTPPRRLFAALRPVRIDEVLYELAAGPPEAEVPEGFRLEIFDPAHPSGDARIDKELSPTSRCYVFKDGDRIAHESWLVYDALLPASFGFDPNLPVIGRCVTHDAYRGRHLYPSMLRLIAADIRNCRGLERVFILVSPDNTASIRGIERAGSVRLTHLTSLRVAGLNLLKHKR